VQVLVEPGKDVLLAQKENDEQDQGDREKGGKGFGHIRQWPAPAGLDRVHQGREEHGALGNGRKEQKVEQVGLPGPGRVADQGHHDENQKTGGNQGVGDFH
jgi:hypothetical protein